MIVMDKEQIKKRQQIYNLKRLLFTENVTSKKLKSKISELKTIFKLIKKIIKEKINLIETNKSDKIRSEIKQQICNEIKDIILIYNNKNNIIISNENKEKKIIRETLNQMKFVLKDTQYYELKDKKDLFVQIIQEKKDLYTQISNNLRDQKDIFFLFQQKYYYHFNNIYEIKMVNFEGDKKYDEEILKIKNKYNHSKKYLKKAGEKAINKLKDELSNETMLFDKYIEDKGFHFQFNNNHYKENYDIEIDVINKSVNSSDSSSTNSDDNNEDKNSSLLINDFLNMNNNDKNNLEKRNSKDRRNKIEQKQKKKNSYTSNGINGINKNPKNIKDDKNEKSYKTFDSVDNSFSNNNINLLNKLVEIKEKYNELINEKFELDYKKKKMEKKINAIKAKIIKIKNNQKLNT